jgi:PHD/YefM family antitoxin component YafN of YafNO toxin-antitoxin module
MAELPKIAEAAVHYGAAVADLRAPLILEQEGRPLAVVIAFEEYQRLRLLEAEKTERQRQAWLEMDALLAKIHSRPTEYSSQQIEAEITAARAEVKERRRVRRGD